MSFKSLIETLDSQKENLIVLSQDNIDEIHQKLLYMLKSLDKYCKKNNIQWVLAGGSILGAVRHHGFIPWDDDADIHMTRYEFEKFKKKFEENPMKGFLLKCPGDENYLFHYPKLYLKDTVFKELQSNDKNPNNLFIDIFILENTYDSKLLRFIHGLQCNFYLMVISALRIDACKKSLLEHTKHSPKANKSIKIRCIIGHFFKFRKLSSWIRSADRCFSKVKNTQTKLICIPTGAQHYFGEIYNRKQMCERRYVPFETESLPIPKDAEKILKQRYGDNYMQLPPISKRAKHAIVEYKL